MELYAQILRPIILLFYLQSCTYAQDIFGNLLGGFNLNNLVGGLAFLGGPQGRGVPGVGQAFGNNVHGVHQQGGCLSRLSQGSIVGTIITGIVESALNAELQKCQFEVPQQQTQTWLDLIPALFGPQQEGQDIASKIFGAVGQTCELSAKQEFCRLLQNEVRNVNCNVCTVIAMAMQPEQIKQCACGTISSGFSGGNVRNAVDRCVGSVAIGALFGSRSGLGNLLQIPGC